MKHYIFGITENDQQQQFLVLQRSHLGLLNIILPRLENKVESGIDHEVVDLVNLSSSMIPRRLVNGFNAINRVTTKELVLQNREVDVFR